MVEIIIVMTFLMVIKAITVVDEYLVKSKFTPTIHTACEIEEINIKPGVMSGTFDTRRNRGNAIALDQNIRVIQDMDLLKSP